MLLDTSITEPSFTADEAEVALFALERSRATFAWKVGGLDTAALRRTFPPSTMTLAGLVKHLALVEDERTYEWVSGQPWGAQWKAYQGPEWVWTSALEDSAEDLYTLWRDAVARSRAAWAEALAHGGLEQPAKVEFDGKSPNLRRALVDLHDEYARHVGHADLFREAIDGLVGEDPPQG
jgi:hypothetical protein